MPIRETRDGIVKWGYCAMVTIHSHPVLIRTEVALPLHRGGDAFQLIVDQLKAAGKRPGEWVSFCVHPLREDGSLYSGHIAAECSHGWYWVDSHTAATTYPKQPPETSPA